MMTSVFVTHKQFEALIKSIEKANLKSHGKSRSFVSMRAGDLILDIRDDQGGMMMKETWREDMRHKYLVPTQTSQETLQSVLLDAAARTKKTHRNFAVVRFTSEAGAVRYKVYPSHAGKAFKDCKVGERIQLLGYTDKLGEGSHPIPFWPQSAFKDEFSSLPVVRTYEISIYGMPSAEYWAKVVTENQQSK